MKRSVRILSSAFVVGALLALAGCTARSQRWEEQRAEWPEDVPMGGTPAEHRQYHEAEEAFEAMMAEEHESAAH